MRDLETSVMVQDILVRNRIKYAERSIEENGLIIRLTLLQGEQSKEELQEEGNDWKW